MKYYDTELKVRYAETDQMGIVHHSRYYPWFEVGRTEYFASGGMSYGEMEQKGVMLPLVETHCRYIIPAKYEDVVIIRTSVEAVTPVKINFTYDVIRKADDALLARGATLLAFTNLEFKPVNMKKYAPEVWDYILNLTQE